MFNYTNGQEYTYEEIDEINSKAFRREYFPDWDDEGISIIDIVIIYEDEETGGKRRIYSDTIHVQFKEIVTDPNEYLDIV